TKDIFVSLESEEPLTCGMFEKTKAQLILRCMENKTAAMLITSCHMASGFQGYGQVEYRVDDNSSLTRDFEASTDNGALGLWDGGSAIPFIKAMGDGHQLLMRFTPFNESPTTAKFDITGMAEAIAPLKEACGW
ncbi:MAG: type VI secretion system-associated protein TagO, partial [Rhodobacteraceae bacterium]|nr:type VI secretion system-associated protein TagO [Paracoccaceae bacterium]